tara:strand:+ start:1944 stop:2156 length:213 start_codon:yes stop_codon:yes gene_type:complete
VESLASQPCATSHHGISKEEPEYQGITDSMLRLSVGIEDSDDLIADLNQALDNATLHGEKPKTAWVKPLI